MTQRLEHAWAATVAAAPEAPALIETASGRVWTRAALAAAAAEAVAALRTGAADGTAPCAGERVLLAEPNGAAWFTAFLALLTVGGVPVPVDPGEPPAGLALAAGAAGARWIWRDGQCSQLSAAAALAPAPSPAAGSGLRSAGAETANGRMGAGASADAGEKLRSVARAGARGWAGVGRSARLTAAGPCLVKLTSGSTGTPRAHGFSHAQMLADGRQVCATMGIGPADRNLAAIPLGHSYGLGNLVVPLLVQGTALVCADSPLPQVLATVCARWRPTVFPAVPALLRALVASDVPAADLASLRCVISAGAPLAPAIAAAWAEKFGRRVHGFYGSSETGGIAFDRTGEATLTGRSVGVPLDGVQLGWGRGQRFTVVSAAVRGRGRSRTADRAELNAHGELVLLGRAGRMLKLGARRVDPAEIERALGAVPGVREAWVALHPERPDTLAAVVATDLAADAVRAAVRPHLVGWKVPLRLLAVRDWPLTARGKTDTRALRALLAGAPATR